MQRTSLTFALSFVLALVSGLAAAAPPSFAGPPEQARGAAPPGLLVDLQLLAFNDYHGHLERATPGSLDGVPAGGAEFLSALLNELRTGQRSSLTGLRAT